MAKQQAFGCNTFKDSYFSKPGVYNLLYDILFAILSDDCFAYGWMRIFCGAVLISIHLQIYPLNVTTILVMPSHHL